MADNKILFKAKRRDDGRWAEGFYVYSSDTGENYIFSGKLSLKQEIQEEQAVFEKCRIVPETMCRYTGMIDRYGKRIWEHDIVKAYERSSKEWMMNEAVFSYGCFKLIKEEYCDSLLCRYMSKHLEVIGNRFDMTAVKNR